MGMLHMHAGRLNSSSIPTAVRHQVIACISSRQTRSPTQPGSRCVRAAAPDVAHVAARTDASGAAAAAGAAATSLIPQTLEEMREDAEGAATRDLLARRGQAALTRDERRRRQRSLDAIGVPSFQHVLADRGVSPLKRGAAGILQLNIGLYCNQACSHCHVESSPLRSEAMDRPTAVRCLELAEDALERGSLHTLDLTGGAPELSPQFRYIVECAREIGVPDIIDRCNLTVLLEPGQEGLVDFLAQHRVRVAASLPCYSATNVDEQRGGGVFQRSIKGLQMLNAAGYGQPGSGLELDLVYNPNGAFLAPEQATLEEAYRAELGDAYDIVFSRLFALNNMPIKRYVDYLRQRGQLEAYMETLVNAFNPAAAEGVMCRDTVSVGWDGAMYDCDFNQQLALGLGGRNAPKTVFDISSLQELQGRPIGIDNHCFGCTAGAGSGCQGSTS